VWGAARVIIRPLILISPRRGRTWPTKERMSVVLPMPFRPIRPIASPLIVDKNFTAVSALTDRNVILVKGQTVFEGSGNQLRDRPEIIRQHLSL
jgi:hypothetical protein